MKKKTLTIVSSCAAIAVCSSLIVGSTYALFTSKDTVNIAVTAGQVNVTAEIGTLKTSSKGVEQANSAWENGGKAYVEDGNVVLEKITPGDSVEIPVSVTNASTVDVLYNMQVALNEEDILANGLEVSISGTAGTYSGIINYTSDWMEYEEGATVTVTVTLPLEAGNEYNVAGENGEALSTDIGLAVGAIQANGAEVGTGKELKCKVATEDVLKTALADGASVVLNSDLLNVETQFVLNGNASLDLNGHTITKTASKSGADHLFTVSEGATSVIKNGAIIDEHSVDSNKGYVIYNHGELTLEDLNMESSHNTSSMICNFSNTQEDIAKLTINGGKYIGHDMITLKCDRWSETYINGGRIETNRNNNILCYGKLVIEDGEFISTAGNYTALVVSSGSYKGSDYKADVVINGGYFGGYILALNGYGFYDKNNPGAEYTRPGNTNVTINSAVIERSVATEFVDGGITYKLEDGDTLVIGADVKYATHVSSQEGWGDTIEDGAIIKLAAGEYTIPNTKVQNKTVEIIGSGKDTVIDRTGKPNFGGTKLTVKNATVKGTSADYNGFQHIDKETYINCVFEDKTFLYANDIEFIDCTFNTEVVDYNIWTYGAKNVTFENCTFNCEGKAVLIYEEAGIYSNVTFNDCTFNANKPVDGKAAIEIDSSFPNGGEGKYIVKINNCTVNGFGTGSESGNSLWNEKKGNHSEIYVNNEKLRG